MRNYLQKSKTDYWLLLSAITLISMGLIMVTSASPSYSEGLGLSTWYFAIRHSIYLAVSVLACLVIRKIPIQFWQTISVPLLFICIASLAILLIPGVSREINGSVRWLRLGPLSIQVSEFTKLALILFMAGYIVRREFEIERDLSGFIKPMILLSAVSVLLLLEPDFGSAVVIVMTIQAMLFMGGVPFHRFIVLLLLAALAFGVLTLAAPYRMARLTSFLDPWSDQFNTGYQLTQSLIAFGRGGWFGSGLGNGVQKLSYLPEPHTDFLFAVLAEELGLIGALGILILFSIFVWRTFILGRSCIANNQLFSAYLCYGIGLWIGFQALINIGVNVGVLPTKGLTLPFMSYGGCSLLVGLVALGLLLRIELENESD